MTYSVLAIDDEPYNLLLIEEYLSESKFALTPVSSAKEALDLLQSGNYFDLILLDLMMPVMDGLQFIKALHQLKLAHLPPIIMQTAATDDEQIAAGIKEGVLQYLPRPYQKKTLLALLHNVIEDSQITTHLIKQKKLFDSALQCMTHCTFSFKNFLEVDAIAVYVACFYPNPNDALIGIRELMINAIEHGNLGISYQNKSGLLEQSILQQELTERLQKFQSKSCKLILDVSPQRVILTIEDEGQGFNWLPYMDLSSERASHLHGRGIAIAKMKSFDDITYVPPGNIVITTKRLSS